jgi:protein-L-isoaspartate(D-aspartate) O-methyltransferase
VTEAEITLDLRRALVQTLRDRGAIKTDAIAHAFFNVPREAFVPLAWPSAVYRDIAIPTKFGRHGLPTSSSSQPGIMAPMLEMLQVAAGHRVLEVGAGTGYNAALLRELVGPTGKVVAIDYQPGVAAEAAAHLKHAGYHDIEVIAGDGALGLAGEAPFDRIIATTACRDVPVAWWEQLVEGGILVLPVRRGPMNFAVFALRRTNDGFRGAGAVGGGFMPMQGPFGLPPGLRFHGPRKDFAVLAAKPVPRRQIEMTARLLSGESRLEQPDALRDAFPAAETPPPGEWIDLQAFLAATEPGIFLLQTRTELYGFNAGLALLEPRDDSLAVLAPNKLGLGRQRGQDFRPELIAFGGAAAGERLIGCVRDFVARGRPPISRLRLALARRRSRRTPWRYNYEYDAPGA